MLSFDQAFEIVLGSASEVGAERVDISSALNRVLAEDVRSDVDMPPFNKAAMDGYACRRQDLVNELAVIETIPAGMPAEKTIGANLCAKIMTGSMVPQGADCVIMKEYVEICGADRIRFVKGTLLRAQHIAALASVGHVEPAVAKRPRVGVIATGDELVEPAAMPGPSQIRNSNGFQLATQVESMGLAASNYGIVRDTAVAMDSMFRKAFAENEVVVVSGGVSVGDYDLVPEILRRNRFELLFEKIAVKPGRPTVFGVSDNVCCFGLPGNPVSGFVMFELLVKPFLYRMMAHDFSPAVSQTGADYKQTKDWAGLVAANCIRGGWQGETARVSRVCSY
jgi:molybdopterin molybdotransferase